MLVGLSQLGLCEEPGTDVPTEVVLGDADSLRDDPVCVEAGNGSSFILTERGRLYSFGNGNQGRLGHESGESILAPSLIRALSRHAVTKVSAGSAHAFALTEQRLLFGWGHNHRGQVGIDSAASAVLQPVLLEGFSPNEEPVEVSCGDAFTVCMVRVTNEIDRKVAVELYGWGDSGRGQLGPDVCGLSRRPVVNKELTRYLRKHFLSIKAVAAGGSHVLLLASPGGKIVSWGASDYGLLGHGYLWDDAYPRIVSGVADVIAVSAGKRHSMCIRKAPGEIDIRDVFGWGYNGYGELGRIFNYLPRLLKLAFRTGGHQNSNAAHGDQWAD